MRTKSRMTLGRDERTRRLQRFARSRNLSSFQQTQNDKTKLYQLRCAINLA